VKWECRLFTHLRTKCTKFAPFELWVKLNVAISSYENNQVCRKLIGGSGLSVELALSLSFDCWQDWWPAGAMYCQNLTNLFRSFTTDLPIWCFCLPEYDHLVFTPTIPHILIEHQGQGTSTSRVTNTPHRFTMVKFGRRLDQNKSPDYPAEAYVDYQNLKDTIHVLAKKKMAGWVLSFRLDTRISLLVCVEGRRACCDVSLGATWWDGITYCILYYFVENDVPSNLQHDWCIFYVS